MYLSELQSKNLVNILNGKNIGNIIDIKMDTTSGKIISLIIENKNNVFSFINKESEYEIKWEEIKKIGEDVILVNTQ